MLAIVDYRAGNLTSVKTAFDLLGIESRITDSPAEIGRAQRVVFPGVGAAGASMENLGRLGLVPVIQEVVASGRPFLGICVGYQVLFEHSTEDETPCLGILKGRVLRFPATGQDPATGRPLKVPQMGWNSVTFRFPHSVWDGVPVGSEFYFVHSYHPVPEPAVVAGTTTYGVEYASAVAWRTLVGFQFHPEKSGRPGLKLLANFARWSPAG
jgi:glutamine amidotransferase